MSEILNGYNHPALPLTPDQFKALPVDDQNEWLARAIWSGWDYAKINEQCGLTVRTIGRVRNGHTRPAVAGRVSDLINDTLAIDRIGLVRHRRRALEVIADLMQSENESIRLKAAGMIRAELSPLMDDGAKRMSATDVVRIIEARRSSPPIDHRGNGHPTQPTTDVVAEAE